MPRHSSFVVSVRGSVSEARRNATPNAILRAIADCYDGRLHRAPISGDDRARRRKIRGTLNLSIEDLANIVADDDGRFAVPVMRAIAEQAAVDHRIVIKECVADVAPTSINDAQRAFSSTTARFIVAVDDAISDKVLTSIERRRLHELEQAVQSRASLVTRAMAFDGVDQS